MRRALLLGVIGAAMLVGVAAAAPGDLDPSFGTGGTVITDFNGGIDQALGVAEDAQSRLVVVGEAEDPATFTFEGAAARYDSAGSLDSSFGTGGKVELSLAAQSTDLLAVAVQPDGKIVVAGQAQPDDNSAFGFVARFNTDGSLDPSFGTGGVFVDDNAYSLDSLALQPDGKIVAAGFTQTSDYLVDRLTTSGAHDATFGTSGAATVAFDGTGAFAGAVALQADGKIVVGGDASLGGNEGFALARLTTIGQLDSSFGSGGEVVTQFANTSFADLASLAIQPDGKIVAGGELSDSTSTVTPSSNMGLARYNANGSLDPSFGTGGTVNLNLGQESPGVNSNENIRAIALQSDGKIVAIGSHSNDGNSDSSFEVARFTTNGALDSTFGSGGIAGASIQGNDRAFGGILQTDSKIVAVGNTTNAQDQTDFGVARFQNASSPVDELHTLSGEVSSSTVTRTVKARLGLELGAATVLAQTNHNRLAAAAVDVFSLDVHSQSGRTIPTATASTWVAQAQQIRTQLLG